MNKVVEIYSIQHSLTVAANTNGVVDRKDQAQRDLRENQCELHVSRK